MQEEYKKNAIDPTVAVIFGATGDLSRRKLLPALFHLYNKKLLPEKFNVVGFSRKDLSDEEFRNIAKEAIVDGDSLHDKQTLESFLENIFYSQGEFNSSDGYKKLSSILSAVDDKLGQCSNKLFHLAVPPSLYNNIFEHLADSGLTMPCGGEKGWTRVLVEKPFGKDLDTARELDKKLGKLFDERQIFRIDHYLAKETLQNILSFRFSNTLFEPLWNKENIEKVEITLSETLGMEGRGKFYDEIGALRDVGQNHLLEMLALIAMENPQKLDADIIRKNRADVINSLLILDKDKIHKDTIQGQYEGYKDEKEVAKDSKTETYFKIKTNIKNERWNNVPFYLESGKKLNESKTEIKVYFKNADSCVCDIEEGHKKHQNILTFRVQPDEGISVQFWAKKPGFDMSLEPKELSFMYNDKKENKEKLPDAYERVLFDCIKGDQTLFASTQELEALWKFITPILEEWKNMELMEYKDGESLYD